MPARISCVCIDAVEPRPVADFWSLPLDGRCSKAATRASACLSGRRRAYSGHPARAGGEAVEEQTDLHLHLHLHLHLDLRADGTSFEAEVVLLQGLGAPRVDVGRGSDVTSVV